MRITKYLRTDQETIIRFLDMLGVAASMLSGNKRARPGFFIVSHAFMHEYIEESFFKKEDLLFKALEDSGFPTDEGPIVAMRAEQAKCAESSEHMGNAARGWQSGDEEARGEVGWAASEYTLTFRQHLDRLNNRIYPLLEQNMSEEDEHKISEGLNKIAFEVSMKDETDKYSKLVDSLQEELSDWR
ncbi:MAG TPA: hemerythrin domain-containing protein [Anaerolineales bacterium]|nr:hemerythrin domain-containing protein [Anaerolineales bacterium]